MNETAIFFLLLILGLAGLFGMLFWMGRRDKQYRKRSVGETMDQQFRDSIDQESKDAMRRRSKFEELLKKRGN